MTDKNPLDRQSAKITNPVKYLRDNIYTQELLNTQISYFIANKSSESGITSNERFFIIFGNQFVGYVSKVKENMVIPFDNILQIPQTKVRIPIDNIKNVTIKDNKLKIIFTEGDKNKEKSWDIEILNKKISNKIFEKVQEARTKRNSDTVRKSQQSQKVIEPEILQYKFLSEPQPVIVKQVVQENQAIILEGELKQDEKKQTNDFLNQESLKMNQNFDFLKNDRPVSEPKQEKLDIKAYKQMFAKKQLELSRLANTVPILVESDKQKTKRILLEETRDKVLNDNLIDWNYEFSISPQATIMRFKKYSECLMGRIVDQMCLSVHKRLYSPIEINDSYSIYEIRNISIKICFSNLAEIKRDRFSQTIYDESALKLISKEFKNLDYLLKHTANSTLLKVPLATKVQYRGFVGFIKVCVNEVKINNLTINKQINTELEIAERETRVTYKSLANNIDIKSVILLDSTSYDLFIDNVVNALPQDVNYIQEQYRTLRPELVQDKKYQSIRFSAEDHFKYLNKSSVDKAIRDQLNLLTQLSKQIYQKIQELLFDWDNLQQVIISPQQVPRLLHKYGINVRYLGVIYLKSKSKMVKSICMSEMISRVAKTILRINLQAVFKEPIENDDVEEVLHESLDLAIQYMNSVVNQTEQSNEVWTNIKKQAQHVYNIAVNKSQTEQSYFLRSLLHQCNMEISWEDLQKQKNISKIIFNKKILSFAIKSKTYDFSYLPIYQEIDKILEQPDEQKFQQLKSLLNLKKSDIPAHFKLSQTYEKVCLFLAAFLEPQELTIKPILPCQSFYQLSRQQPPTLTSIEMAIFEMKWALKQDNREYALKIFKRQLQKVNRWCGELHPVLNQIYSILAQYYLTKSQYEEAITYVKTCIGNYIKLLGGDSLKTAQCYYQLAQIYLRCGKKQEGLNTLKKAKSVFQNQNQLELIGYGSICHRIGVISLSMNKNKEAQECIIKAMKIYETDMANHESQAIECYELLARIYQIEQDYEELTNISKYCGNQLRIIQNNHNLQRILKIVVFFYLNIVQNREQLYALLTCIPLSNANNVYENGINHIIDLIQKNKFISNLNDYLNSNSFDKTYSFIAKNGLLNRWKGLESASTTEAHGLLAMFQALFYILGQNFILGCLTV